MNSFRKLCETVKKNWKVILEIGIGAIILLFVVSYLAYDKGVNIKSIIYYFILIMSSMLGSMIGINKRKAK